MLKLKVIHTVDMKLCGLVQRQSLNCAKFILMWLHCFILAGAAEVSVGFLFFPHNMVGNIELKVNTTNNHPTLTSYFVNPSFKKTVLWKSP